MAAEKFKLWYDEKEEVLRTEIYKRLDVEAFDQFYTEFSKFTPEQQSYVIGWLYDDAQQMVGKEERKVGKEKAKLLHFKKMAVCGCKPVIRMVASVVISALGKAKDAKFCSTEEEALAWIRAEKEKDKKAQVSQR